MDNESSKKLEFKIGFDKIRTMIKNRCSTLFAMQRADEFEFLTDPNSISKQLSLTDEMKTILMLEPTFPTEGYVDTVSLLSNLEAESSWLDLPSVVKLRSVLETIKALTTFFDEKRGKVYPNLKQMTEPVILYPEVLRRIDTIIDKYGEIRDTASQELYSIRRSIKDKESNITKRISAILKKAQSEGIVEEDAQVVVRDGKMLIPVNSGQKRKIAGIVHDESASGKTSYLEPFEVIELDNQIKELYFAQQREIQKILIDFSDFLRPYLPELIVSAGYVCEMDFIIAKGRLAVQIGAGKPIISLDDSLTLYKARHPILESALKKEGKEIVPLNLKLSRDKHILLISGPNAGGKSVCLKTTGILQYMFQTGLLVTAAETSEFPIFEKIFIDIGDEQSIENDLSTYSSHLLNMRTIVESSNEKSLILIDEFGAGTEPTAGGAIAEAILEEIEKSRAYGVITTHYTNLKLYASSSKGVINGGMQFDVQNIKPLFKLETGTPGSSFAFELARKIGLPYEIVKRAEERAGGDFISMEKHLKKIAKNRRLWEEKLLKIKNTDKVLESVTDKYQKELNDLQSTRKKIISEAKEEARLIIEEANKRVETTIKEIKESQAEKEKTKILRNDLKKFNLDLEENSLNKELDDKIEKKIEQLRIRQQNREKKVAERGASPKPKKEVVEELDKELKVGDKVKITGSDLMGEITKIDKKDVSVAIGNIISVMSRSKVIKISNNTYNSVQKNQQRSSPSESWGLTERKLNFKPFLDVRGERLDSALEKVDAFMNDSLMVGIGEVKILHGKGTGVLKEEIRKYLKTIAGVNSFKDEILELGGSGITVVKLD